MGMTVYDNQPPTLLLVDIPHQIKGTTRIILYRGIDATELYVATHLSLAHILREAITIAADHKPKLVLVTGPDAGLEIDLSKHGLRAFHFQ